MNGLKCAKTSLGSFLIPKKYAVRSVTGLSNMQFFILFFLCCSCFHPSWIEMKNTKTLIRCELKKKIIWHWQMEQTSFYLCVSTHLISLSLCVCLLHAEEWHIGATVKATYEIQQLQRTDVILLFAAAIAGEICVNLNYYGHWCQLETTRSSHNAPLSSALQSASLACPLSFQARWAVITADLISSPSSSSSFSDQPDYVWHKGRRGIIVSSLRGGWIHVCLLQKSDCLPVLPPHLLPIFFLEHNIWKI